jgi:TolB protein
MPPRGIFRLWVAALIVIGAGPSARAEQHAKPQIVIEEFIGGTGASAAEIVRKSLERSGKFSVHPKVGQWLVRASSSAGRIDGALVATNGSVVFNNHYDSLDLFDNAKAYADDIIDALTGERGIALSRIAFVSDKTGSKEIYICDSDGQRIQQITRDRSVNVSPTLSPGAGIVAYTSYLSGFPDIFVTRMSDGLRQRLISSPGTNSGAAISHDGSRLALTMTHQGDPEIYITSVKASESAGVVVGGRSKRLTESRSVEFSPAWAPDGERLVFCSDATGVPQLYICPRRGGDPQRLDTGPGRCTDPDWNADGHLIAFTSWRGRDKSIAVYELETGRTRLVLSNASDPSWAPDGRHLVVVQSNSLVVLNVATGAKDRIVSGVGNVSEPAWSR